MKGFKMDDQISILKFGHPELGVRVGVHKGDNIYDVTERIPSITHWLEYTLTNDDDLEMLIEASESSAVFSASDLEYKPSSKKLHWLAPIDHQDVWASGVTYQISRNARQEESKDGGDVYQRVFSSIRPELFYKSKGKEVMGHLDQVGIRNDTTWNVPEPELCFVINRNMKIVGLTAGNDMSSRDIEGENPLYLPQAKNYLKSCALGKEISVGRHADFPTTNVGLTIQRGGQIVFEEIISTKRIARKASNLLDFLGRSQNHEPGVFLMTGTGIVPPSDFTLAEGDTVTIEIDEVTSLKNEVVIV
ncbi:MAG: fumarylacetoacetate hydrolase family protein [Bacteroidota bacterium]